MARNIVQGKIELVYQCPHCKANMKTEHTRASEFDMLAATAHWASTKKLKWEGQCPICFKWVEVMV